MPTKLPVHIGAPAGNTAKKLVVTEVVAIAVARTITPHRIRTGPSANGKEQPHQPFSMSAWLVNREGVPVNLKAIAL